MFGVQISLWYMYKCYMINVCMNYASINTYIETVPWTFQRMYGGLVTSDYWTGYFCFPLKATILLEVYEHLNFTQYFRVSNNYSGTHLKQAKKTKGTFCTSILGYLQNSDTLDANFWLPRAGTKHVSGCWCKVYLSHFCVDFLKAICSIGWVTNLDDEWLCFRQITKNTNNCYICIVSDFIRPKMGPI